jgi:hypothetical protein
MRNFTLIPLFSFHSQGSAKMREQSARHHSHITSELPLRANYSEVGLIYPVPERRGRDIKSGSQAGDAFNQNICSAV